MTSPFPNAQPPDAAAAGASASDRLRGLAALPLASPGRRSARRLISRVDASERAIEAAYRRLAGLPRAAVERSRAAEWLLDNHYIVQRAVRGADGGVSGRLRAQAASGGRRLAARTAAASTSSPASWSLIRQCRIDIGTAQRRGRRAADAAHVEHRRAVGAAGAPSARAARGARRRQPRRRRPRRSGPGGAAVGGRPRPHHRQRDPQPAVARDRELEAILRTRQRRRTRSSRRDPAAIYGDMDFDSRDRYRKVVEVVAASDTRRRRGTGRQRRRATGGAPCGRPPEPLSAISWSTRGGASSKRRSGTGRPGAALAPRPDQPSHRDLSRRHRRAQRRRPRRARRRAAARRQPPPSSRSPCWSPSSRSLRCR